MSLFKKKITIDRARELIQVQMDCQEAILKITEFKDRCQGVIEGLALAKQLIETEESQ